MHRMMSPAEWARTAELARRDRLTDAQMAGLAIGCPAHGNAWMDWDDDGVFCHHCVSVPPVQTPIPASTVNDLVMVNGLYRLTLSRAVRWSTDCKVWHDSPEGCTRADR